MTYDEAMNVVYRNGKQVVTRLDMRVAWRFGRAVILGSGNTFIDYTPTEDDMRATDWAAASC